jgi:hypothetical protein
LGIVSTSAARSGRENEKQKMNENWNKEVVAKNEKREFYVIFSFGRWFAEYKPINQKTGKAWQSSQPIYNGERSFENLDFGSRDAAVAAIKKLAQ